MHPPRPMSPNTYLQRHTESLLTPARTPNPSGHLNQHGRVVHGHSSRGMKSPGRGNYNPPSDDSYNQHTRTPSGSGANSPQHAGTWTSPNRHRKNPPLMEVPSPTPPKRFGWLTPTRSTRRRAPEPTSPDFASSSHLMRDLPEGNVPSRSPARSMKSGKHSKLQHSVGSVSPARSVVGKVEKEGKSPAKSWKNLSRTISPFFGGKKSDHTVSSTSKTVSRDLGVSFQSSRRRAPGNASVANATANVPNWSGDSSIVAPDLEKDTTGTQFIVCFENFPSSFVFILKTEH